MHRLLACLAVAGAALAEPIGHNCINSLELQGSPKGKAFSDKEMVATRIDKALMIFGYTECNDVIGDLMSFTLILADSVR